MNDPGDDVLHLAEDRQRRMLASAVEVACRLGIQKEGLVLGGGAILQACWEHRRAEGIWLFADSWDEWAMGRASVGIDDGRHLKLLEDTGGRDPITDLRCRYLRWTTDDGPVGIYADTWPVRRLHKDPLREATTGIHARRSGKALDGNIQGRLLCMNQFPLRDAVDVVVAARKDPQALRQGLGSMGGNERSRRRLEEIRWQTELSPREDEREIREAAAACIEAVLEDKPVPVHPGLEIPETPPVTLRQEDPLYMKLHDQERFSHPMLRERSQVEESLISDCISKCMAGHPLNPTAEEVQGWLLTKQPEDLPSGALSYLQETFKQLNGEQISDFRQRCGASLADIARMLRWARSLMTPSTEIIVNQYAHLAAGDDFEIADANAWLARGNH